MHLSKWPQGLARAHCARGASTESDVAVHGVQGAISIVGRVRSVGDAPSAGPGVVSGARSSRNAHEIVGGAGAVVPGGTSVAVNVGGIRDDGTAEDDDGKVLEEADILELLTSGPCGTVRQNKSKQHQDG